MSETIITNGKIDYEKMQEVALKRLANRRPRPELGHNPWATVIHYGKDGL